MIIWLKKIPRAVQIIHQDGFSSLKQRSVPFFFERIPPKYDQYVKNTLSEFRYGVPTDPLKTYWIRPQEIEHSMQSIDRRIFIGTVKDGNWDQNNVPFSETTVYKGLRQRFVEGKDWNETCYYQQARERIEKKGDKWGHQTIDSFEEHRCAYIDELFERIKTEGYKTQSDIKEENRDEKRHKNITERHIKTHEIGCNIGREGEFILNTGNHRLAIAKILDIEKIPIKIIVRHERWQQKRKQIAISSDPTESACELCIDSSHPDIQNIN